MAFRGGGGRRFNNRSNNSGRGGNNTGGMPGRQGGFSLPSNQNPSSQGSFPNRRAPRAEFNKPRICMSFQQGSCVNNPCRDQHQYSYNNEIGRLQQVSIGGPVFASNLVNPSQVCVALQGRIAIFDLKSGQKVFEVQVQGRTKALEYSEDFGQGFIFFAGDTSNRQLLGGISNSGGLGHFSECHASGLNCLKVRRNLIFAGSDDGKVSVWYFAQGFVFGCFLEADPNVQAQVLCLEVMNSVVFAGLANGRIVGWEYNFEKNTSQFMGSLNLGHNGRVTSLQTLADQYLFSGGDDGMVNCWDSQNQYQGGCLLNATKAKPVQISSMLICEGQTGTFLILGTGNGKILWYNLQGSEAKFMQPLSYHRKSVTGLLLLDLEGHHGFISTSIDGLIHVSNWNISY
jgi:WD40 repeat protein